MKNFVANLLLVFSSLVISCLLFEIFLRIFYPMQESIEWFESSENMVITKKRVLIRIINIQTIHLL